MGDVTTPLCQRSALYHNGATHSFGALERVKATYHRRILLEQRKPAGRQDITLIKDAYHNINLIELRQREASYLLRVML